MLFVNGTSGFFIQVLAIANPLLIDARKHYRLDTVLIHVRLLVREELTLHLVSVNVTQLVYNVSHFTLLRFHLTLINEACVLTKCLAVPFAVLKQSIWNWRCEVFTSLVNVVGHRLLLPVELLLVICSVNDLLRYRTSSDFC